jgi:hypothetical protein
MAAGGREVCASEFRHGERRRFEKRSEIAGGLFLILMGKFEQASMPD